MANKNGNYYSEQIGTLNPKPTILTSFRARSAKLGFRLDEPYGLGDLRSKKRFRVLRV